MCKHVFSEVIHYFLAPHKAVNSKRKRPTLRCGKCGHSLIYLKMKNQLKI